MTQLLRALNRTFLLMRDDLVGTPDEMLLDALTATDVVLTANAANLRSHSAQSAFITTALLMVRSGHTVYLDAPDVPLLGPQPPLTRNRLMTGLLATGPHILPGVDFKVGVPARRAQLEVRFGDSRGLRHCERSFAIVAGEWAGVLGTSASRWPQSRSAMGGLAAAALSAGEAFKVAMLRMRRHTVNQDAFLARFAPYQGRYQLAAEETPLPHALGDFDVISAGAISNAFFYTIARILDATGNARVFDHDIGDISNLNRNMHVLVSDVPQLKVDVIARAFSGMLKVDPVPLRFDQATAACHSLRLRQVLLGVDHIPTRWIVQGLWPSWLAIGATSHWSAMASYHTGDSGCARCLHRVDDPTEGPIPTVAFVSYWAGLLLATHFVEHLGNRIDTARQQIYLSPLRPEVPWNAPVPRRRGCPLCATLLTKS